MDHWKQKTIFTQIQMEMAQGNFHQDNINFPYYSQNIFFLMK